MILECTQCRTRYLVPDSAIGADGRTVRCANCKHSWHQPGIVLDLVARAEASASAPASSPATRAPAPIQAPGAVETPDVEIAPPGTGSDYDAFAHQPPFRPRRNPAKRWTMAAFAAGFAMLVGVGAILYSGAPGLASQLGLPIGPAETPLRILNNPVDRRDLDNGSQLFAISGKILNPTDQRQRVPDIRAELRDAQDRPVYSWTIRPEVTDLGPRGSVEFNSAKLDVPATSKNLLLSFSGETAP